MTQAVHNHQAVPRGDPQRRPGEKSEFEYDIWLIGRGTDPAMHWFNHGRIDLGVHRGAA